MNHLPLCQQITFPQVQLVVHAFYSKLQNHPQLGHFFKHIHDFTEHEYRISGFWWLSMGGKLHTQPKINMIDKHMPLGIKENDLLTWLSLFEETLNEELAPQVTALWMQKALQIADRLRHIVIEGKATGLQISEPSNP